MGLRIVRVDLDNFVERRNRLGPPAGVEVLLAREEQRLQPMPLGPPGTPGPFRREIPRAPPWPGNSA